MFRVHFFQKKNGSVRWHGVSYKFGTPLNQFSGWCFSDPNINVTWNSSPTWWQAGAYTTCFSKAYSSSMHLESRSRLKFSLSLSSEGWIDFFFFLWGKDSHVSWHYVGISVLTLHLAVFICPRITSSRWQGYANAVRAASGFSAHWTFHTHLTLNFWP